MSSVTPIPTRARLVGDFIVVHQSLGPSEDTIIEPLKTEVLQGGVKTRSSSLYRAPETGLVKGFRRRFRQSVHAGRPQFPQVGSHRRLTHTDRMESAP